MLTVALPVDFDLARGVFAYADDLEDEENTDEHD